MQPGQHHTHTHFGAAAPAAASPRTSRERTMVVNKLLDKYLSPACIDGFTNFLESKPPAFLAPFLSYYTPKYIKIDYWPIAALALVLKLLKRTLVDGGDMPLVSALRHEQAMIGLVLDSADAHEGCTAFLEKRDARFEGK